MAAVEIAAVIVATEAGAEDVAAAVDAGADATEDAAGTVVVMAAMGDTVAAEAGTELLLRGRADFADYDLIMRAA